jgi:RNA polymerase sigma-70 factor (ECF subfamily)
MQTRLANTESECDIASIEEVREALLALSRNDLARLNAIAKIRARAALGLQWQDLLHTAVERVIDGSRRWPRDLSFLTFMRQVMRSLASEHVRKAVTGPIRLESDLHGDSSGQSLFVKVHSEDPDPEREVLARQALAVVRSQFADDAVVLTILEGMKEGLSPSEIQRQAGIDQKAYATAQKRLRRGLARTFPEGIAE